jgi:hypothetical protein
MEQIKGKKKYNPPKGIPYCKCEEPETFRESDTHCMVCTYLIDYKSKIDEIPDDCFKDNFVDKEDNYLFP